MPDTEHQIAVIAVGNIKRGCHEVTSFLALKFAS